MKETALALALIFAIFASLIIKVQFVDVVEANPVIATPSPPEYPAKPSQEFPTINMDSPKNGEVLTTNSAEINFTVTKPSSWYVYWNYPAKPWFPWTTKPVIGSYIVHVYLDGKLNRVSGDPGPTGFPNAYYSILLSNLTRGIHSANITVVASTYYADPSFSHEFLSLSKNITETRQFTITADLPTTPAATPEPTPKANPFPTTLIIGSAVAVAAVVCLGLLVYLKKRHRRNKNS